jgi:hypothetical protein
MSKKVLNLFILSILSVSFAIGQAIQNPCGTTYDMQMEILERTKANKETLRNNPIGFRDVQYVPLRFHIVSKSDGKGGVSEQKIYDQLCELNETYLGINIQFYLKPFNYINNSTMYSNHTGTSFLMQSNKDAGAINLFIVQDAQTPTGIGTTLGYYTPQFDWLVVKISEVGRFKKTISHEVGHFFSLDHPFLGWDHEPYDEATHGNPVGANSPEGNPNEYQDGSNCETAGDLICDTPPDYNFGFGWGNCNYTGGTMDPGGTVVDPQEINIMSYFLNCAVEDYIFSPMQGELMITDLNSQSRNYIRPDYIPSHEELTGIPQLIAPLNDELQPAYNTVHLEWEPVEGANHYFLEISRISSFSTDFWRYKTTVYGTSKTVVEDFEVNKSYYWRVRAVNETNTCATYSSNGKFKTGTTVAVNELDIIEEMNVVPNPVSNNTSIQLRMNIEETFEGQINMVDLTGKVIKQLPRQQFNAGLNTYEVSLNGEAPGIYFLNVISKEGMATRKVVITD